MSRILKLKNKMNMKNLIKYGFIAVVMLSFISCTVESYEWDWGKKTCKDHNGLREIKVDLGRVRCTCNDGFREWDN